MFFCWHTLADVPKNSAVLLLLVVVKFHYFRHSDSKLILKIFDNSPNIQINIANQNLCNVDSDISV